MDITDNLRKLVSHFALHKFNGNYEQAIQHIMDNLCIDEVREIINDPNEDETIFSELEDIYYGSRWKLETIF